MPLIVSDSSCLIDLKKASLLKAFIGLPHEILIPDALFEDELVQFTTAQKKLLLREGLKVIGLPGESVLRARAIISEHPSLSIHYGFAFALAESCDECILLTGDAKLRAVAETHRMEVHGVLWATDEIDKFGLATPEVLQSVLRAFADAPSVRLPRHELAAQIERYRLKCDVRKPKCNAPAISSA